MKEDFEEIFAYQDDRKATVDVREAAEILGAPSQHRVQIHPFPAASGSAHRTPLADRQKGRFTALCAAESEPQSPNMKGISFF